MAPLTLEQIKEAQEAAMAEDIAIDFSKMSLWSLEQVTAYFESGGQTRPAEEAGDEGASLAAKARGNEKLKAGELDEAISAYREAISLGAADVAPLHSNLSLALLKQGKHAESLAEAELAAVAKPEWQKGHYRAGEAHFGLGQYDEAFAANARAKALAPADADIAAALAAAEAAQRGGFFFKQLLPGRDIARTPTNKDEELAFGAARQMANFIYLVGDLRSRECFVVDACWDVKGIAAVAAAHKMKLVGAVASHYHFDHTGGLLPAQMKAMVFGPMAPREARLVGLREMKTDYGCQIYSHEFEVERLAKQIELPADQLTALSHGQKLRVGSAGELEVLHTPGHSGGSVCLHIRPTGSGAAGSVAGVLVGDTIFPGSCGRLDLPDSDTEAMFDSLSRLREMDDSLPLWPGHAYGGEKTTIAAEKTGGLLRPFTREQWRRMHG